MTRREITWVKGTRVSSERWWCSWWMWFQNNHKLLMCGFVLCLQISSVHWVVSSSIGVSKSAIHYYYPSPTTPATFNRGMLITLFFLGSSMWRNLREKVYTNNERAQLLLLKFRFNMVFYIRTCLKYYIVDYWNMKWESIYLPSYVQLIVKFKITFCISTSKVPKTKYKYLWVYKSCYA